MTILSHLQTTAKLFLISTSVLLLGGCDPMRSQIAELIAPETPAQALQATDKLIGEGKYQEAKNKALIVADKPGSVMRGEFAFAASRASALQGDTQEALRYLALAFESRPFNTDTVMNEPAFHNLQTNVQFLQIITQNASSASGSEPAVSSTTSAASEPPARPPTLELSAGGAQIRQDSKGTEVRAGDVIIKLPN